MMMNKGCYGSRGSFWVLVAAGLLLGVAGVGNLLGNDWNFVGELLDYGMAYDITLVLAGVAAVMKLFHCRCKQCSAMRGECGKCGTGGCACDKGGTCDCNGGCGCK